jgi:hypothetical protein
MVELPAFSRMGEAALLGGSLQLENLLFTRLYGNGLSV